MASESSAKAGSNALSGKDALSPWTLDRADSRNEEREEGRRGVVGLLRDVERGRRSLLPCLSLSLKSDGMVTGGVYFVLFEFGL